MTVYSAGNKTLLTILSLNANSPNSLLKFACVGSMIPAMQILTEAMKSSCLECSTTPLYIKKFNNTLLFLQRYIYTRKLDEEALLLPDFIVNSNLNTASRNSRAKFTDYTMPLLVVLPFSAYTNFVMISYYDYTRKL